MGIFLVNIIYGTNQEKCNSKQGIEKKNLNLNQIPNPHFKNQITIAKNHQISHGYCGELLPCYEIYTLNNETSSLYIAFKNLDKFIEILKYNFKDLVKITTININPQKIKYFNDEIHNKEYLIIQTLKEIYIFLIISENIYKKIFIYQEKGIISSGFSGCYKGILPINDFHIFRDIYNDINYLIISFFYRTDCSSHSKKISILKLEKYNCIKVKEVESIDSEITSKKLFLIWEDKSSKLYNLIYNLYNDLIFLEINDLEKENKDKTTINGIIEIFKNYIGCIISDKNKKDYLYLIESNCGLLTIVDLKIKQKIKAFYTIKDIESIINWNNKYIIFSTKKFIYTFDTFYNKIINKKSFNLDRTIISISKFIYEEQTLFSLVFNCSDKSIIIIY